MHNKQYKSKISSILLVFITFTMVFFIHYLWYIFFPEQDQAQSQWVMIPDEISSFQRYIDSQNYWFGYTYGICFAFICLTLRNYLKNRYESSQYIAVGGMTLTGFWSLAACFLVGCCGSPMIIVWMNLFGAKFLPIAKPLVALITTISLIIAWLWMKSKMPSNNCNKVNRIN